MIIGLLWQAWRQRAERPGVYRIARWVGFILLLEAILQVMVLVLGLLTPLLIIYTIFAALAWALMVALLIQTALQAKTA